VKRLRGTEFIAAAVTLTGVCLAVPAPGQETPAKYPNTIVEVRVEGNKHLSDSAVLARVKTRPQSPYDEAVVREDQQRLLKTRRFDKVLVEKLQTDKGIIVTFRVTERAVVKAVGFVGNKAINEKKLRGLLTFGEGDPIDMYQIASGARAVESRYRGDGYRQVKVDWQKAAVTRDRIVAYRIVEGPQSYIQKVVFEGNRSFSSIRLGGVIKSRRRLWPFRAGLLDLETVERDVVDLANFYRSEGYLDVEVAWKTTDTPDKQKVRLIFLIGEGPRYRVRGTSFTGAKVFSPDEMRKQLKLTAGSSYDGDTLQRDTKKIHELYGEIGYIDAQVSVKKRYADPGDAPPSWFRPAPGEKPALVDLVYEIVESEQFRVGKIDIRGNDVTKMNVIRRQFRISPGQLYNTAAVDETRHRLMETGLFKDVAINDYGDEPGVRHALVQVTEAETAMFLIGAGISSNAGVLGNVSLTERNFDLFNWGGRGRRAFRGAGQIFSMSAEPGTEFMRFHVSWREPYLMDKPYSLGTKAYLFTAGRETWDETRYGGVVSLGRRFKNRWYAELAARVEGVQVSDLDMPQAPQDVRDAEGNSLLIGPKVTLVRDKTDSRWLPSKGDRITLSYEQVVGDWSFGKAMADYHIYHTVHMDGMDRKHILAGRLAGGGIVGDAPVFERFYGGGLGSLRGFDYRGVSPRQGPFNEVIGGDFMVFAGGEYTFPLVGKNLRGVVFLDTGTVESDFSVSTYRAAGGVGVRLHVPFFGPVPMSLDFGFPINKDGHDDTQLISFSFGWVF